MSRRGKGKISVDRGKSLEPSSTVSPPEVKPNLYNLRKACQDATPDALKLITDIMRAEGDRFKKARLALRFRAAEFIIERGWGLVGPAVGDTPPAEEYASTVREATALMNTRTVGKAH